CGRSMTRRGPGCDAEFPQPLRLEFWAQRRADTTTVAATRPTPPTLSVAALDHLDGPRRNGRRERDGKPGPGGSSLGTGLLMAAEGGTGVRQDPGGGRSVTGGRAGARGCPRAGPAVWR